MSSGDTNFDFQVRDRLHIMPVGFEYERAYLAAKKLKADRVILIGHEKDEDQEYIQKIKDELDDLGISHDFDQCDIFDLYDSIGMIAKKISQNEDDEVYVNVSTGGKITAIAGMIACMVTGATPYYVQAEDYSTPPQGIEAITELPRYPIDSPRREHVEILQFLENRSDDHPSKGELIKYSEEKNLPFISRSDVKEKSKYRILDDQIIDPLQDAGYVEVEESGRERIVRLTEDGENTLTAFKYMINT